MHSYKSPVWMAEKQEGGVGEESHFRRTKLGVLARATSRQDEGEMWEGDGLSGGRFID